MQTPPTSSTANGPTLRDINLRLGRAGLPSIPPERIREIVSPEIRDRFLRSVYLADQDTEALKFVQSTLRTAGLVSGQTPGNKISTGPGPAANDSIAGHRESVPNPGHGRADGPQTGEGWESFHVYGSKAALCFNADVTKGRTPTIAIDAASSTGPHVYDWKQKVRLQLTKAELPVVAAVLLGALGKCEFKNHGANKDKGFTMERQDGGKIFISVFAKGTVKAVPVFAPDVMWVTALVLQQVQKSCPGLDSMGVITLLRITQGGR